MNADVVTDQGNGFESHQHYINTNNDSHNYNTLYNFNSNNQQ